MICCGHEEMGEDKPYHSRQQESDTLDVWRIRRLSWTTLLGQCSTEKRMRTVQK